MSLDPGREAYVSLATFRRDGREVRTPVWIAAAPGDASGRRAVVYTNAKSGKVKRIRNDATVRLAACDLRGKVHGDWQNARARQLTDPDAVERGLEAIVAKYGWQMRGARLAARLSGRWADRAVLEIELGDAVAGAAG